jgi:hypothetical protein
MNLVRRMIAGAACAAALAYGGMTTATAATPPQAETGRSGHAVHVPPDGTMRPAGTCDGAGCNGQDPIAAGCAGDAYDVPGSAHTSPEGTEVLRYSPSCHANWARITNSYAGAHFWVENTAGDRSEYQVPGGYSSAYTDMVNGYPMARACDDYGCGPWE